LHPIWKFVTEFGDTAVLAPLAAVMLLWLLFMRRPRGAAWWAIAVVFCAGSTALFKVFIYGCSPSPDLHSPSGHTSLSTLVYGAIALVTAAGSRGLSRILAISGGFGIILAIAASHLVLYAHSEPEVGLGFVLGTAALALFGLQYRPNQPSRAWLIPLLVTGGVLLFILHGRELRVEDFIRMIAGYLRIYCA